MNAQRVLHMLHSSEQAGGCHVTLLPKNDNLCRRRRAAMECGYRGCIKGPKIVQNRGGIVKRNMCHPIQKHGIRGVRGRLISSSHTLALRVVCSWLTYACITLTCPPTHSSVWTSPRDSLLRICSCRDLWEIVLSVVGYIATVSF